MQFLLSSLSIAALAVNMYSMLHKTFNSTEGFSLNRLIIDILIDKFMQVITTAFFIQIFLLAQYYICLFNIYLLTSYLIIYQNVGKASEIASAIFFFLFSFIFFLVIVVVASIQICNIIIVNMKSSNTCPFLPGSLKASFIHLLQIAEMGEKKIKIEIRSISK